MRVAIRNWEAQQDRELVQAFVKDGMSVQEAMHGVREMRKHFAGKQKQYWRKAETDKK